MVQFVCPRVIHPLVSFTFGVILDCPFHWMQEKENSACGPSSFTSAVNSGLPFSLPSFQGEFFEIALSMPSQVVIYRHVPAPAPAYSAKLECCLCYAEVLNQLQKCNSTIRLINWPKRVLPVSEPVRHSSFLARSIIFLLSQNCRCRRSNALDGYSAARL